MEEILCSEIIKAVNGELIRGSIDIKFQGISTDSRKIKEGDLFIPISGPNFNGHDFILQALQAGATGAITHEKLIPEGNKTLIRVEDTLKALGDIAAFYRRRFSIPLIAVTGSVGKTTVKEMISCVIGEKLKVLKSSGNFNNEVGLPLTLLNIDSSHQAAVVEMGMRGFKEIERLSLIAKPDIAIITNIGISHIERLGSRQNILKAKMEIIEGLNPYGAIILNGDESLLYGLKGLLDFKTVFYGMEDINDIKCDNIRTGEEGSNFDIITKNEIFNMTLKAPGIHNIYNAIAAVSAGLLLGLSPQEISEGIKKFTPGDMRLKIIGNNGIKIIDDSYNASPQSMIAALEVLRDIRAKRKIAILGDMLELGQWSEEAHKSIGKFAVTAGIDYIITVGNYGEYISFGAQRAGLSKDMILSFENSSDAADIITQIITVGDAVLVKGSRGIKMELITKCLSEKL